MIIKDFNKFVSDIVAIYKYKINDILVSFKNEENVKELYSTIEKNYPQCKPASAKRALEGWDQEFVKKLNGL